MAMWPTISCSHLTHTSYFSFLSQSARGQFFFCIQNPSFILSFILHPTKPILNTQLNLNTLYLANQWLQMFWPESENHNSTHEHFHYIDWLASKVPWDAHPHISHDLNVLRACAVGKRSEVTSEFFNFSSST